MNEPRHPTYHLVPVDPAPEMVDAVNATLKTAEAVGNFWTGYRAFLAARPVAISASEGEARR